MSKTRIVGVCLVRNEENFVAWSILNIADFCDEIIVLDNKSTDRTPEILAALSRRLAHVRVIEVDDAYDTHKYVERFAGNDCWVFGVDGDEIYDAGGLARLRPRILSGEFNDYWRLFGHALHVERIDWAAKTAFGHGQPEARSITKLYNFKAITSWHQGKHQRLHGKSMQFLAGYHLEKEHNVWEAASWSESDLRCLHLCFVSRSPNEQKARGRPNPSELMKAKAFLRRAVSALGVQRWNLGRRPSYKERFYSKGTIEQVDIAPFGRPVELAEIAPTLVALE